MILICIFFVVSKVEYLFYIGHMYFLLIAFLFH